MRKRTTTGNAVHASSSFVAPWIGAPSSKRGALLAAVLPDERDQEPFDEDEDRERRRSRRRGSCRESPRRSATRARPARTARGRRRDDRGEQDEPAATARRRRTGCHSMNVPEGPYRGTRVRLPADVVRPFEVFVNGVAQRGGRGLPHRRPHARLRARAQDRRASSASGAGCRCGSASPARIARTTRSTSRTSASGKPVVATQLPLEPLQPPG